MSALSHQDMITLLLAVGLLLGAARLLGEVFARFGQPAVVGELAAGILLGPTVLGAAFPALHAALFPSTGNFGLALDSLTGIAIVMFLLVAGMEVDLSSVWRQGKTAFNVSIFGLVVPFALGFVFAWYLPMFREPEVGRDHLTFSLFFATALSISALPVVAKILMDLGLFRTDLGMVVVAAAILNDLAGWIFFAVLLGMISADVHQTDLPMTVLMLVIFISGMLTVGKRALNHALPWIQAHTTWPGGVLGFSLTGALLCAALTEWIGIHGIFGAFIFGVALGDSRHLRGRTRRTLEQFISFIFAPLFFASIGLRVDFVQNFDFARVLIVLILATIGKVVGCGIGARLSGMGKHESWAVGFAMNARGAMEIILGLLALEAGLIGERMFVALVIMALVTSMSAAFFLQVILKLEKPRRFFHYIPARGFIPKLSATDHYTAVRELAQHTAALADLDTTTVADSVWRREQIMPTSLGGGVAIPHARVPGLKAPVIGMGISPEGVDMDAADGALCHVLCLILTPADKPDLQLEVLSDIARTFQRPNLLAKVMRATTTTELLSLFKTQDPK